MGLEALTQREMGGGGGLKRRGEGGGEREEEEKRGEERSGEKETVGDTYRETERARKK